MSSIPLRRTSLAARRAAVALGTLGMLLAAGDARAEALRCKGRLATPNMHSFEVQKICGAPQETRGRQAWIERTRIIQRRIPNPGGPNPGYTIVQDSETYVVPVDVEEWIYMGEPGDFARLLIFEGGRLAAIRTLDRNSTYVDKVGHILELLPPHSPHHERRDAP